MPHWRVLLPYSGRPWRFFLQCILPGRGAVVFVRQQSTIFTCERIETDDATLVLLLMVRDGVGMITYDNIPYPGIRRTDNISRQIEHFSSLKIMCST